MARKSKKTKAEQATELHAAISEVIERADASYAPEVDTWDHRSPAGPDVAGGTFDIFRCNPDKSKADDERVIFSIIVNEKMSEKEAERLADFISYAPQLWRALRHVAPLYLNNVAHDDSAGQFGKIRQLLCWSAERNPYFVADDDVYGGGLEEGNKSVMQRFSEGGVTVLA